MASDQTVSPTYPRCARDGAARNLRRATHSRGERHSAFDGTLGGIGGGQYSGNGRAAGMAATEDLLHMLEGMGIETGVNLDKLIECVWMCEEILGRHLWGHVSRTGPRPTSIKA